MGCLPEGCLKCDSLLWLWSVNHAVTKKPLHISGKERETLNFLSPIVNFSVLLTHYSNLRTVWMDNRWWEERWKLPCSLKAVLYWIYLFLFLSPPVKSSQSSQRMCFEREQRICLAKVTHIISLRPPPTTSHGVTYFYLLQQRLNHAYIHGDYSTCSQLLNSWWEWNTASICVFLEAIV